MPLSQKKSIAPKPETLEARIVALEREVEVMKKNSLKQKPPKNYKRLRFWSSLILIILSALFFVFSVAGYWVKRNVVNTDVWVSKANQVIRDPSVRSDIAATMTNNIFDKVDVEQYVSEALPDRAQPLAAPINNSLKGFTQEQINKIMQSQAFLNAWEKINQSAHSGIVNSINKASTNSANSGDLMYFDGNQLMLNLQPIYSKVLERLESRGLGFVSKVAPASVNKQIQVAQVEQMPTVLLGFKLINRAGLLMLIPAVILGALAALISTNRRKLLIIFSVSAIVFLVCGVQAVYLAQYPFMQKLSVALGSANTTSAQAVYKIYTSDLVFYNRLIILILAIVILFAFLSGPARPAVWLRMKISRLFDSKSETKYLSMISNNSNLIIAAIIALALVLVVFPLVKAVWYLATIMVLAGILCVLVLSIKASAGNKSKPQKSKQNK